MKNVTFSADEALIDAARARAASEQTTLNDQFRIWLASYAQTQQRLRDYERLVEQLQGRLVVGRKLDRDAMNER